MSEDPGPNPFVKHNHRQCRTSGLREAQDFCTIRGLRLTPVRARVLEILLESHSALGAYDILDRLKADGLGGQPPVVYRALDFLSDRVICLNGHVCCEGTPTVVSEAPEYQRLFGHGTEGALALYQHHHDHDHDHVGHSHG
ncbi:MAG: hypothetical protein O3C11_04275 [Proteobacteria bacterium]|nr:hypothetical protein [Pseudomonadota bacterium]